MSLEDLIELKKSKLIRFPQQTRQFISKTARNDINFWHGNLTSQRQTKFYVKNIQKKIKIYI